MLRLWSRVRALRIPKLSFYRLYNRSYRDLVRDQGLLHQLDVIILAAAFGNMLFANTGGAAFTGYASAFGAGALMFGFISALPVLTSLLQLLVSYLVERTGDRKKLFLIGGVAQRSLWISTAFIPWVVPDSLAHLRVWVLLVVITLAGAFGSFVNITFMSLFADVVPMEIRGRYITVRQRTLTVFSMASGLAAAYVLDHVTGFLGFSLVFGIGGVFGLMDILSFARFPFPPLHSERRRLNILKGFQECFGNKVTRDFLLFWATWGFTINLSSTFFSKYAVDVLRLPFTIIVLFGQIAANVTSILVISRWGRFLDRYGAKPLLMFTCAVTSIFCLVWMPATPGNPLPLFLFNFFGGFVWCGTDACAMNMQITHTPDIGRPLTLAVYAIVANVSAALAFICGGTFLEWGAPVIEAANITIVGIHLDNYKALFAITAVLRGIVVAVMLPRVWNEKGYTVPAAYRDFFARLRESMQLFRRRVIMYRVRRELIRRHNQSG